MFRKTRSHFPKKAERLAQNNDIEKPLSVTSHLELLPNEMLMNLFRYLDNQSLFTGVSYVNHRFKNISEDVARERKRLLENMMDAFFHDLYKKLYLPGLMSSGYFLANSNIKKIDALKADMKLLMSGDSRVSVINFIYKKIFCDMVKTLNPVASPCRGYFKSNSLIDEMLASHNRAEARKRAEKAKESSLSAIQVVLERSGILFDDNTSLTIGLLFCLRCELDSLKETDRNKKYRCALTTICHDIISTIKQDQVPEYNRLLAKADELAQTYQVDFALKEMQYALHRFVPGDRRAIRIIHQSNEIWTSIFKNINTMVRSARHEDHVGSPATLGVLYK